MEAVPLSLAALIGVLTFLLLLVGTVITGMRMYAGVQAKLASLEAHLERLDRLHDNGHHKHPGERLGG